jgi:hypothetical protein
VAKDMITSLILVIKKKIVKKRKNTELKPITPIPSSQELEVKTKK